jgi:L-threonylcarbamoyladenylate synthase
MTLLGKDILLAANFLTKGKLVAIPTETVYGLAANALNEQAVLSVFEAKNRPFFDPLIMHVSSFEQATQYANFEDERLIKLAHTFWPGPLTLLLPKKAIVPDLVSSGLPQVAIRVPNHLLTLQLLQQLNFPLAAPSANPFGYISPTEPSHVAKQLGEKVNYILDGGICEVGIESTIVGLEEGELCVYRLGGLSVEEIEKAVGHVELRINHSSNPKAPGQLKSHYAPRKLLKIGDLETMIKEQREKKIALIYFGKNNYHASNIQHFPLSEKGDLREAALNLFRVLREADESNNDIILCEKLPDIDLGRAVNDRLQRAQSVDEAE